MVAWCRSLCLFFIYFFITYIHSFNHIHSIHLSVTICRGQISNCSPVQYLANKKTRSFLRLLWAEIFLRQFTKFWHAGYILFAATVIYMIIDILPFCKDSKRRKILEEMQEIFQIAWHWSCFRFRNLLMFF